MDYLHLIDVVCNEDNLWDSFIVVEQASQGMDLYLL